MSAPEFQTQDQVRKEHNNTVKFKEGWEMKVAAKATKIKMMISKGLATQHPAKLVGILALVAILMAGTAVQFVPGSDEASVNDSSVEKVEAVQNSTDSGEMYSKYRFMDLEDEPLSVEFLRTYVYPEEAAQVKAPTKSVDTEYRFMDLEDEPLSVEFLRTYVYPEEAAQVKASAKNVGSEYRFMDLEDEPLSVEFLRTYVYPGEAAQVKASAKNVGSEYRFMDLEDEPLSVEFLRTYVYPGEAGR